MRVQADKMRRMNTVDEDINWACINMHRLKMLDAVVGIQWVYTNMHRLKTLDGNVAALRAKAQKHCNAATKYEKRLTSALKDVENMKLQIRSLEKESYEESRKAREAEAKVGAEKLRAHHLELKVLKLERLLREARKDGADGELTSVIRKIKTSSTVGKRLAAAVHPDKMPPELSDVATEVFQFIQGLRDNAQ